MNNVKEVQMNSLKEKVTQLLSSADITLQGGNPWDIQVFNDNFYRRVLTRGTLGLGESYMDGWWEAEQLDEFFYRVLRANLGRYVHFNWKIVWDVIVSKIMNLQTPSRSFLIGKKHYDLGNDLFERMLDKRMVYSCAYWDNVNTLDEAQEAKLELVCRKLGLRSGMKVLDIGCGWGSFAKYAAEKYNVEVLGITVSSEQVSLARKMCERLPVEIKLQDYRDLTGTFDRIVSIGMFEHVGAKNYRTFFRKVKELLREDGIFLLHTIGSAETSTATDLWIAKYIFPNSHIPSQEELSHACDGIFVMEDWHNFGVYYDKTLMAWYGNFEKSWETLQRIYDKRFYRMWKYYLLSCAGSFRARYNQLWQIVFSPNGIEGGYRSVRAI
jgi:cyclopropane-fatty-acyl-phospholipid synthase